MPTVGKTPWIPFNFLALPQEKSGLENSRVVLIPIPYDSTTSYRTGARDGPMAILRASYNLEDYDHELGLDISEIGIHTTHFVEPHMDGPLPMVQRVKETVYSFASQNKVVGLLGGEHTITIGAIQAFASLYPSLSVLYLDAHGDLRDQYMNTAWSHATVARRLHEISHVVQVGVRSISQEERDFIERSGTSTFFWDSSTQNIPSMDQLLPLLSPDIYISVDLDVFDPSIMAAVGTPEPGGMNWNQVTSLIALISQQRNVVGFDVTELSPQEGPHACAYTAAKLVSKLIVHSTNLSRRPSVPSQRLGPLHKS